MAVYEVEILQFSDSDKGYIIPMGAARYLHMNTAMVYLHASLGNIRMEQIESRWLLEWESVKTFALASPPKRQVRYEVKIIWPALPQC